MKLATALSLLVLFAVSVCAAGANQQANFTASVDRNRVGVGEQFELTFSLEGSGGNNFRPPALADFAVLSGPNQSMNTQFINGSISSSVSYGFILQPRTAGKFTIGAASIEANGKLLHTQPIAIEVTKGAPAQAQSRQGAGQPSEADVSKEIGDNLLLRVSVDRSRVYQGEQITVTYKICTRVNVVNYSPTKLPSLTGFWSEDLDVSRQVQLSNENINGKAYRVGILKKVALFPQRSGTLEIDPMEVDCAVQVQARRRGGNSIFDQFFNDPFFGNVTNVSYKIKSDPVKITVQPLPSAGVPEGFSGAVGKFAMESWLDKRETKANEPVTLKVKITGQGNIKLLQAPNVSIPPDLEKYDPKISDNLSKDHDKISGSRTFEYLLIPRHAGEQRIPPIRFSYFDIDKKSYVSTSGPSFALTIGRGAETTGGGSEVSGVSKEDVKLLGEDIRFLKSGDGSLRRKGEVFAGSPLFFVLSVGPVLAFVGFLFFVRKREKMLGDVTGLRIRRARKMAQRRLGAAKRLLDEKKNQEFYTEISRALWGYMGDKLGIPPADLSIDAARSALAGRNVPGETVEKLASTIEQCEFARFAPGQDALAMDAVYRGAVDIISSVEDQLR
jgi:hypothetical protein